MKIDRLRTVAAAVLLTFATSVNASGFEVFAISDYLPEKDRPYALSEKAFSSLEMRSSLSTFTAFPDHAEAGASGSGFDLGGLHKYLGYSTVVLAGLAAVSSSNRSVHYGAAYAATGTGLAACLTGYAKYGPYLNLRKGLFSENNLHAMLGVLGTAGFAAAVAIADSGENKAHAGIGSTAAVSALFSVIVIKW